MSNICILCRETTQPPTPPTNNMNSDEREMQRLGSVGPTELSKPPPTMGKMKTTSGSGHSLKFFLDMPLVRSTLRLRPLASESC